MTAAALVGVAAVTIWLGGVWFVALCALAAGVMVWELVRMLAPAQPGVAYLLGALASVWILPFWQGSFGLSAASLMLAPVLGLILMKTGRLVFVSYGLVAIAGCYGFAVMREFVGIASLVWVIAVVAATDVAGYFAGRMLGGPKFWPRISPKKTWSGTVAGWVAAAGVGWMFVAVQGFDPRTIVVAVLLSLGAQMGDIGESAVKRSVGAKDSSRLLPGHGGFLDRFDGMIGAGLVFLLAALPLGYFSVVLA